MFKSFVQLQLEPECLPRFSNPIQFNVFVYLFFCCVLCILARAIGDDSAREFGMIYNEIVVTGIKSKFRHHSGTIERAATLII